MMFHRLLILAADPLIRAGFASLLASGEELEIAGQGHPGDGIETLVDLFRPTAVLWDLGWDGAGIMPLAWEEFDIPLIVLLPGEMTPFPWLEAGAAAVLGRDISADTVLAALVAADSGLVTIAPGLLADTRGAANLLPRRDLVEPLTNRETEILRLLADGLTNKAIAATLEISSHTVKFHVTGILSKLNAQSRTEAVSVATRLGLLSF